MCDLFPLRTFLLTPGDYGGWATITQILSDIITHLVVMRSYAALMAVRVRNRYLFKGLSFITCSAASTVGRSLVNSNV